MTPAQHPKRPLVPAPLNRLDQWLLKNYPDVWSARTHLVLWFTLLLYLVIIFFAVIVPDDPRTRSGIEFWSTAAGLLGFVGMVLWFIYLFRFNVFKRFGNLVPGDRLRTFMQFYITFLAIVAIVFVPTWVDQVKTKIRFDDEEIVKDVNLMNYYYNVAELGSFRVIKDPDTLLLNTASRRELRELGLYTYYDSLTDEYYPARLRVLERREMEEHIASTDSSRKLGNVGYIFYEMANLNFISTGQADNFSSVYVKTKRDLYDTVYNRTPEISPAEALQRATTIAAKYKDPDDYYQYYYETASPAEDATNYYNDPEAFMNVKHKLNAVDSGIYHITSRMHPFGVSGWLGVLLAVLYVSLGLTVILFGFRHTTVRTFFFSLLAGTVLAIITALFFAMLRGTDFSTFAVVYLLYFVTFFVLSFTIPYSKVRSLVKGIALNFSMLMVMPVPVIIAGMYYEIAEKRYYATHTYENIIYPIFPEKDLVLCLAQVAGAVILLGLVTFYFSKRYRQWYAQPEE
jgi:hypothetical protein